MRFCSIHGCRRRHFARDWCLEHYCEFRRVTKETIATVRAAEGSAWAIARQLDMSPFVVWEIKRGDR